MSTPLSETGVRSSRLLANLPEAEDGILGPVMTYFSSAWPMWILFGIGIWLGFLLGRHRRRLPPPAPAEPIPEPDLESPAENPEPAVADPIEVEPPPRLAELEGKLAVARKLSDQRENEVRILQQRLEAAESAPDAEPATTDSEKTIAHLNRQLALRESETVRLNESLEQSRKEAETWKTENERLRDRSTATPVSSGDSETGGFVRRLLGLESEPGLALSSALTSGRRPEGAVAPVTLSEAREILSELKLAPVNGAGNGGHSGPEPDSDSASKADEPPGMEELREQLGRQKARIRELEQSLAAKSLEAHLSLQPPNPAPGNPIRESRPVIPGDRVDTTDSEVVIFRGDDSRTWNTSFSGPGNRLAIPLEELPDPISYLRIRRLDTGDSVVLPINRDEMIEGTTRNTSSTGWAGKQERYFGADHLGIFDDSVPREVETRFGVGGWGFGHVDDIGSGQAFGWAGKQIPPTSLEISVGTEPLPDEKITTSPPGESSDSSVIPAAGLILFRSNDPEIWGTDTYAGMNHRARSLSDLPDDIAWLRLRRLPGGESIVLPVTTEKVTGNGDGSPRGFNGSNEWFYGARHLGIFDEALAQEVETRFSYGGWGFGHCPTGPEKQTWGWAGRKIAEDTLFEITVYREQPTVDEFLDRVLTE